MDREVIERKLESLRHCLLRIEAKCPADPQTLANDPDLQDSLPELVREMVEADYQGAKRDHLENSPRFRAYDYNE